MSPKWVNKAVINGTHLGLLFKNEVFRDLKPGEKSTAYIKSIREDRKIDLSLEAPGRRGRETLGDRILSHLAENNGISDLTGLQPARGNIQAVRCE